MGEDVGRLNEQYGSGNPSGLTTGGLGGPGWNTTSTYPDFMIKGNSGPAAADRPWRVYMIDGPLPSGNRRFAAWADGDTSNGVSGPPNQATLPAPLLNVLNNNVSPFGGPLSCPWSFNNCGPNDEFFGFHPGGLNLLFADGSVRFVR
jgi:prepilin-type processing-associated H-X9-DG protein